MGTHAVTYGAGGSSDSEVHGDEIIPYSYEYTVSDPETNNNFNAVESDDGTGVRSGSYSVSLPDSRIQHVTYTTTPTATSPRSPTRAPPSSQTLSELLLFLERVLLLRKRPSL